MSRPFAVFDIDGTLIRWQLYHAITDAFITLGFAEQEHYKNVRATRKLWKERAHSNSFKDYELSLVAAYDKLITELTFEQFESAVETVFTEYKDQVYTFTRDQITELKKQGYVLLAISGSQSEIVSRIADYYGFDDYIGTTYERGETNFTGAKNVASKDKAEVLRALITKHKLTTKDSVGIGDSEGDIPMLAMVDTAIAFNPTDGLFKHAKKAGWEIVIERKNVIYRLTPSANAYQLQDTI